MAEEAAAARPRPVVSYLKIPDAGDPYLEGSRCGSCGAIFLGERQTCSKCGTTGGFEPKRLSDRGEPYVSAIVDLEGGGTVKGNLIGIDPDPEKIRMGMPVEVVYEIAPRKDQEGNEYLTYYFKPRQS